MDRTRQPTVQGRVYVNLTRVLKHTSARPRFHVSSDCLPSFGFRCSAERCPSCRRSARGLPIHSVDQRDLPPHRLCPHRRHKIRQMKQATTKSTLIPWTQLSSHPRLILYSSMWTKYSRLTWAVSQFTRAAPLVADWRFQAALQSQIP